MHCVEYHAVMIDILWDLRQEWRINEAQDRADGAARQADNAKMENRYLRRSVERLALANMAMWELVCQRLGLTDEQLMRKMEEIDLRDGVRDGRITEGATVRPCLNCGRKQSARQERCMYCGHTNDGHTPFVLR